MRVFALGYYAQKRKLSCRFGEKETVKHFG